MFVHLLSYLNERARVYVRVCVVCVCVCGVCVCGVCVCVCVCVCGVWICAQTAAWVCLIFLFPPGGHAAACANRRPDSFEFGILRYLKLILS
jgi:hypothetical protein